MKLKCIDGKTRDFEICHDSMIPIAALNMKLQSTGRLQEAYCKGCGEKFGYHDTYILKPEFKKHICKEKE